MQKRKKIVIAAVSVLFIVIAIGFAALANKRGDERGAYYAHGTILDFFHKSFVVKTGTIRLDEDAYRSFRVDDNTKIVDSTGEPITYEQLQPGMEVKVTAVPNPAEFKEDGTINYTVLLAEIQIDAKSTREIRLGKDN